jgi:hypothetical protein
VAGGTADTFCVLRSSVAPGEDLGRLLSGQQPSGSISCHPVHFSRLRVSASYGQELAWGQLHQLLARCESAGAPTHADRVKAIGLPSLVHLSLEEIARILNLVLRGWIQYYGGFFKTELIGKLYHYLDDRIAAWLRQEHKRLRSQGWRSWQLLNRLRLQRSDLFAHWHRASAVVSG